MLSIYSIQTGELLDEFSKMKNLVFQRQTFATPRAFCYICRCSKNKNLLDLNQCRKPNAPVYWVFYAESSNDENPKYCMNLQNHTYFPNLKSCFDTSMTAK